MKDKNSFLMYTSWADQINLLSDEDAGKLLKGVMAYSRDGTEPDQSEVGGAVYMAFAFIRSQIDENNVRYQKTCEARAAAGSNGGRPKKQTDDQESKEKQTKAKKAIGFSEKQTKAKKPDNDNEYENEDDNDKDKDIKGYGMRGAPQADSAPAVIALELNDSTFYEVTQRQVKRWQELYPAVEIMGELRKMSGWLEANPKRRKTRAGILRFITSWLSKEQDKGGMRHAKGGVSDPGNQGVVIPGEIVL